MKTQRHRVWNGPFATLFLRTWKSYCIVYYLGLTICTASSFNEIVFNDQADVLIHYFMDYEPVYTTCVNFLISQNFIFLPQILVSLSLGWHVCCRMFPRLLQPNLIFQRTMRKRNTMMEMAQWSNYTPRTTRATLLFTRVSYLLTLIGKF